MWITRTDVTQSERMRRGVELKHVQGGPCIITLTNHVTGRIAISLGPPFSEETERIGNIAMPISTLRLHAVDDMTIGRLGASISRGGLAPFSVFGVAV